MGLFKRKEPAFVVPEGADVATLVFRANAAQDPVERHALLSRAEEMEPDNLAVQRALLLLGRLHERNAKRVDFTVIKSYLLRCFEYELPRAEYDACIEEMTNHPRLARCLSLCADRAEFLSGYFYDLSRQYIELFLRGDSRHVPNLLGFTSTAKSPEDLALPSARIIEAELSCEDMPEDMRLLAARAFYRAFSDGMGGKTQRLDELLGAQTLGRLA